MVDRAAQEPRSNQFISRRVKQLYQQFPQMPQYPLTATAQHPQSTPQYPVTTQQPAGTLEGFFSQPSSDGDPSWKFNNRPIGTSYTGVVARAVTNSDIRVQTNQFGQPTTYRDGRPKYVMVVPMLVQANAEFPEGRATWWVKGQGRDELVRAMAAAGAPEGAPEPGAVITVTKAGERPVPGMNPQIQYRVDYRRPDASAPVAAPTGQPQPPAAQQVPAPAAPVEQPVPQAAAAQPQPQPLPPAGFSPEQQALMRQLTGS
jgi:hypothetical protein